ncbi:hypothetical protein LWF01_13275 [Saxibacter everestensis]|uniref:DUF485 domain-containing protein n=1 Tax=Saxibacter everestensis TaxID=2909229 RepID=A0ABY8QS46_9MICO|nr:hypothetical protein LWF01_13275 [Brevibacteriaceae bacterium ZFBP1038]
MTNKRVRVTAPQMAAYSGEPPLTRRQQISQNTEIGRLYMATLIRTQLRLAVATVAGFVLMFCGLPLAFWLAPSLRTVLVLGIPLPWLALGLLAYPFTAVAAWFFVRQATRAETEFTALVHGDS